MRKLSKKNPRRASGVTPRPLGVEPTDKSYVVERVSAGNLGSVGQKIKISLPRVKWMERPFS